MEFSVEPFDIAKCNSQEFPCSNDVLGSLLCGSLPDESLYSAEITVLIKSFPALFSDKLSTLKAMVCHIDLSDTTPVRSKPYQCSPPRLQILREIVQDLVEKEMFKKSYSQYASPTFLAPKLLVVIGRL
jgi:hypothetical protein